MDISKFYELRTRLYNTAAAGCMTVSEDFRLKRAVEEFKPLAEANKAFAKLLSLCELLLASDKPESVIADCIALAEALAVTQGVFADNADTTPANGEFAYSEKPASTLEAVETLIHIGGDEMWKLSAEYKDTLCDPRIVSAFLCELEKGKFNENFQIFCEIMCELCGKALVPALKASIEDTGRQLKYIVRLSGDEENELFRALATDESRPEKVRIEAVSALSCSPENGALLAEIFNTSKGKIKDAALLTLAEMDAPEAEPIFEKLLPKYKKTYAEAVAASSGKACTEFTKKHLLELLDIAEHAEDSKARTQAGIDLVSSATTMLQNKTELDDVFLELSAHPEFSVNINPKYSCISALMRGMTCKNAAAVRAQIDRLYAKAPDVFCRPKIFADFLEHPEKEPVVPNSKFDRTELLRSITYVPILGNYFFAHGSYSNNWVLPLQPLCKRLPEWMLKYIRNVGDEAERLFRQLDAPKRETMLKNAEKLGFKGDEKKDALKVAFESARVPIDVLSSVIWRNLLPYCAKEDYEPIREAAVYFAKKCLHTFSGSAVITLVEQLNIDMPNEEFVEILIDFTITEMKVQNAAERFMLMLRYSKRFAREELTAAVEKLRARVTALRGTLDDKIIDDELNRIDSSMKSIIGR